MYKHKLQFDSNLHEAGMTIPANTNADAAAGVRMGGQEGRLAITIVAKTQITVADTKIITVTVKDSLTETGSYVAVEPTLAAVKTASGETVYEAGDEIMSVIVPRGARKWVKPNIATDDAAVTGTMDVFAEYLAN